MKKELHYLIMVAQNLFFKEISCRTRKRGLQPGQPKILEFLETGDGCTQKEIGENCVLDKSTITGLLSRMGEKGLIFKREEAEDRRKSRIFLTEQGKETAKAVVDDFAEVDEKAWGGISQEEQRAFLDTLEKICKNLYTCENEVEK